MDTYWVPGVNNHGRWAIDEFRDVYAMQSDFEAKVEAAFNAMIEKAAAGGNGQSEHNNSVHYNSENRVIRS